MPQRLKQEEFINKSKNIFGDLLEYYKVNYVNSRTPIILVCKIHGDFISIPKDHLCYKRGCLICSNFTCNTPIIIEKFIKTHGDTYLYDKVVFNGVKKKVIIICKMHGEFKQTPEKHCSGQGCAKCAGYEKKSLQYIIKMGNKINNNKYDYSKVVFTFMSEKIEIICPIHNSFWQTANNHIIGKQGCLKCATKNSRSKQEDIIEQFIQTHGDRYDYSKVDFTIFAEKVEIICRSHGPFWQLPSGHIAGSNCPKCLGHISQAEQNWLDTLNIPQEYRHKTIYTELGRFQLDAYDTITNTIYEFNGDYWHGNPEIYPSEHINKHNKKTFGSLYNKTIEKKAKLISLGYNVISIWEHDFNKLIKNSKDKY